MRYYLGEGHPDAPDGTPWAVCSDDGPVSFHADRAAALGALLELSVLPDDATAGEVTWEAVLMFQDVETGDRRIFHDVGQRTLPQTLMYQFTTSWGHDGAVVAGRIDEIDAADANGRILGRGVFDMGGDDGANCARVVGDKTVRGVSVDLSGADEIETEIRALDGDGWPIDWLEHYYGCSIMGATVLPFPAFEGAEIWITSGDLAPAQDAPAAAATATVPAAEAGGTPSRARVASARPAAASWAPPSSWFEDPGYDGERVPLTVGAPNAAGISEVYGHIYGWGDCHIGDAHRCLTAEPSAAAYAYFRTGAVLCDDGRQVSTGPIVIGADHAPTRGVSWLGAQDHYANAAHAVADVACGDDGVGIWVHGCTRPGVSEDMVHALRASAPSGDWREIGGHLELIAILSVNTPGFPLPRALVASGRLLALTAGVGTSPATGDCGCGGHSNELAALAHEFREWRRQVEPIVRAATLQRIRA